MNTYICAPTEESAKARASASGITDGFKRVGPDPADVANVSGGLLFANDWRDTFEAPKALGMGSQDVAAFLDVAHKNTKLSVEVV